ncbi:TetR/AcrR family transcriptional regulator [Clostridium sp. 19966]|uniref:TetR/AcrR family transcriptional regulator n=1 Tax=Clostridium sp. 19966 TaxID=2768166 RepID=UPI0028E030A8|nr:TetR/AcrR family transcriptional regulator [Clostridium sp. 19966]MDT8718538.1 TetR/AcrR family transcriptional regulator [Clostridium sp. 19966]
MYELFEKLDEAKRNLIIDCSIKEFTINGYHKASTNNIVKAANISKGALFNYFGSKKNLFLYVLDYTTDYYVNYIIDNIGESSPDLFQRILQWTEFKIKISMKNPLVYKFFISAFLKSPEELKNDLTKRYAKLYEKGVFLALDGIDKSKFRTELDVDKSIEIILYSLNGVSEKNMGKVSSLEDSGLNSIEERFEDIKKYIEVLRKAFYSKEFW